MVCNRHTSCGKARASTIALSACVTARGEAGARLLHTRYMSAPPVLKLLHCPRTHPLCHLFSAAGNPAAQQSCPNKHQSTGATGVGAPAGPETARPGPRTRCRRGGCASRQRCQIQAAAQRHSPLRRQRAQGDRARLYSARHGKCFGSAAAPRGPPPTAHFCARQNSWKTASLASASALLACAAAGSRLTAGRGESWADCGCLDVCRSLISSTGTVDVLASRLWPGAERADTDAANFVEAWDSQRWGSCRAQGAPWRRPAAGRAAACPARSTARPPAAPPAETAASLRRLRARACATSRRLQRLCPL